MAFEQCNSQTLSLSKGDRGQTFSLNKGDCTTQSPTAALEETATQSPRSTAHSFNSSSAGTPWSVSKSAVSRGSCAASEEEDCNSASDAESSSGQDDQQEEYEDFLRDFAGSFDNGGEEDEEDSEDEPDSPEGDDAEVQKAHLEVQSGVGQLASSAPGASPVPPEGGPRRSSSCSSWDDSDSASDTEEGDSLETQKEVHLEAQSGMGPLASSAPAAPQVPVGGRGHRTSSCSSWDDSDAASDHELGSYPRGGVGDSRQPGSEYPSPLDDDYDVVKAVQHFASQRPGNPRQHWCEDMQAAIRLSRRQAYYLGVSAAKPHSDRRVRWHYLRTRTEHLMQAKALEARLLQVAGPARDARVPGARCTDSLLSSGGSSR